MTDNINKYNRNEESSEEKKIIKERERIEELEYGKILEYIEELQHQLGNTTEKLEKTTEKRKKATKIIEVQKNIQNKLRNTISGKINAKSGLLGMIPLHGPYKNIKESIQGKDRLTQREMKSLERVLKGLSALASATAYITLLYIFMLWIFSSGTEEETTNMWENYKKTQYINRGFYLSALGVASYHIYQLKKINKDISDVFQEDIDKEEGEKNSENNNEENVD